MNDNIIIFYFILFLYMQSNQYYSLKGACLLYSFSYVQINRSNRLCFRFQVVAVPTAVSVQQTENVKPKSPTVTVKLTTAGKLQLMLKQRSLLARVS